MSEMELGIVKKEQIASALRPHPKPRPSMEAIARFRDPA